MVEMALTLPLLVVMCLGATDMSQAYRFAVDSAGAARAGMKDAISSQGNDLGLSVRDEPNSVIKAATSWGKEDPGGGNDVCTGTSQSCGDTNGCPLPPAGNSPFNTAGVSACFAVRTCTVAGGSGSDPFSCTSFGAWGTRPDGTSTAKCEGVEVLVVIAYKPNTPYVAQLAGHGGTFYLTQTATGLQLYSCTP